MLDLIVYYSEDGNVENFDLMFIFIVLNATFRNISAISWRPVFASDKVYKLLAHGR
jgi:hypothetical protein